MAGSNVLLTYLAEVGNLEGAGVELEPGQAQHRVFPPDHMHGGGLFVNRPTEPTSHTSMARDSTGPRLRLRGPTKSGKD